MGGRFNLLNGDYVILQKTHGAILARMKSLLVFNEGRYSRACDDLSYHSNIIEIYPNSLDLNVVCREWGLDIYHRYTIDSDRVLITTRPKEGNR